MTNLILILSLIIIITTLLFKIINYIVMIDCEKQWQQESIQRTKSIKEYIDAQFAAGILFV